MTGALDAEPLAQQLLLVLELVRGFYDAATGEASPDWALAATAPQPWATETCRGAPQTDACGEALVEALSAYVPLEYTPSSAGAGAVSHAQLLQSIADTLACLGPAIALQGLLAKVTAKDRCVAAHSILASRGRARHAGLVHRRTTADALAVLHTCVQQPAWQQSPVIEDIWAALRLVLLSIPPSSNHGAATECLQVRR